jgi:hypothetical protein
MNVEIGTEAAQFPEKEYINGIFLAVQERRRWMKTNLVDFSAFVGGGKDDGKIYIYKKFKASFTCDQEIGSRVWIFKEEWEYECGKA